MISKGESRRSYNFVVGGDDFYEDRRRTSHDVRSTRFDFIVTGDNKLSYDYKQVAKDFIINVH